MAAVTVGATRHILQIDSLISLFTVDKCTSSDSRRCSHLLDSSASHSAPFFEHGLNVISRGQDDDGQQNEQHAKEKQVDAAANLNSIGLMDGYIAIKFGIMVSKVDVDLFECFQ